MAVCNWYAHGNPCQLLWGWSVVSAPGLGREEGGRPVIDRCGSGGAAAPAALTLPPLLAPLRGFVWPARSASQPERSRSQQARYVGLG